MKRLLSLLAVSFLASSTGAAPTINGVLELVDYGGPLAVQSVETDFGDSSGGLTTGGELDAGYAVIDGGRLYVMLTGNIQNNFNKVSVFIDSVPGGENVLTNIPQYDVNNVSQNFGGLTFDSGFQADYHLFGRWGPANGNTFEVDIANRAGGGNAAVAVNGAAAGAGLSFACACDIRLASDAASFVPAFINVGLVPDSGGTYFVVELLGYARAFEWMTSGRKLSAAEAHEWGLVSEVVAGDGLAARAGEVAAQFAAMPTRGVGMTKRLFSEAARNRLEDQLELEAELQTAATQTNDFREGVAAFLEKRKPDFTGS